MLSPFPGMDPFLEDPRAVPLHREQSKTGRFDDHVCIHRFDNLEDDVVYPIMLKSRRPKMAIPLLPGDSDVTIDLEAIFDKCYETALYTRCIRYLNDSPLPPLSEHNERWTRQMLEHK